MYLLNNKKVHVGDKDDKGNMHGVTPKRGYCIRDLSECRVRLVCVIQNRRAETCVHLTLLIRCGVLSLSLCSSIISVFDRQWQWSHGNLECLTHVWKDQLNGLVTN